MIVYYFNFTNYYDRIVKREDNIGDYRAKYKFRRKENQNFCEKDGITATLVYNATEGDEKPTYVIMTEETAGIEHIVSRWFVMDDDQTRKSQTILSLRRDVICDNIEAVLNSPAFIEKATLGTNNPLIFNSENMSYNEIKQKEFPLKDQTTGAWIVGYIKGTTIPAEHQTITITGESVIPDYELTSLDQYKYNDYVVNPFYGEISDRIFKVYVKPNEPSGAIMYGWGDNNQPRTPELDKKEGLNYAEEGLAVSKSKDGYIAKKRVSDGIRLKNIIGAISKYDGWDTDSSAYLPTHGQNDAYDFLREAGKLIKVGAKFYTVKIENTVRENDWNSVDVENGSAMGIRCRNLLEADEIITNDFVQGNGMKIEYKAESYNIVYEPTFVSDKITVNIPDNRRHLSDAPYDMFAIPYTSIKLNDADKSNTDVCMRVAREITLQLSPYLYDIQLLPYCPLEESAFQDGGINSGYFVNNEKIKYFDYIVSKDGNVGAIYWCGSSAFRRYISHQIEMPSDPIDFKVENECNFCRLVSPNFNGSFQFSPAKNRGVSGFVVAATYKPYQPYIKISPKFGGLYGKDFDDARGLILGGDFSLPTMSDAWINFEYNNKNYQNIFNRQIESMEIKNDFQREHEKWNMVTGALGAGVSSGIVAGGMFGAPVGIAAGAVAGTASLIAGEHDRKLNEGMRQEALDYTKDMYGYRLGNIKALPSNLTRVSAFNVDNKIFPILEYYSCTETEKNALREKLKYNGMTVMAIGKYIDYIQTKPSYIKGTPIRLSIKEDNHMLETLAYEMYKGVFI